MRKKDYLPPSLISFVEENKKLPTYWKSLPLQSVVFSCNQHIRCYSTDPRSSKESRLKPEIWTALQMDQDDDLCLRLNLRVYCLSYPLFVCFFFFPAVKTFQKLSTHAVASLLQGFINKWRQWSLILTTSSHVFFVFFLVIEVFCQNWT